MDKFWIGFAIGVLAGVNLGFILSGILFAGGKSEKIFPSDEFVEWALKQKENDKNEK